MVFLQEPGNGSKQDSLDIIYALMNIIAANFQSLLPEPFHLTLLNVEATTDEHFRFLGMEQMSELVPDCHNQPVSVGVWYR